MMISKLAQYQGLRLGEKIVYAVQTIGEFDKICHSANLSKAKITEYIDRCLNPAAYMNEPKPSIFRMLDSGDKGYLGSNPPEITPELDNYNDALV
jgi:hypothetical protein